MQGKKGEKRKREIGKEKIKWEVRKGGREKRPKIGRGKRKAGG